ncbi:MAG: CHAT domain-containing protein [Candidatus Zixiibacteriota bacterium]|nr:MAG: CHAT domain-containing protein [candidate division Zixibacteria bacterium]
MNNTLLRAFQLVAVGICLLVASEVGLCASWQDVLAHTQTQAAAGNADSAQILFEEALKLAETQFSKSDSTVDIIVYESGVLHHYFFSSYESAIATYEQLAAGADSAFGVEHLLTATVLLKLTQAYSVLDMYPKAAQASEVALAALEKLLGPADALTIGAMNIYGRSLYRTWKFDQAKETFQNALSLAESNLEPDHAVLAQSLTYLANIMSLTKEYEVADSLYTRAIDVTEKRFGSENEQLSDILRFSGWNFQLAKEYSRAEERFRRSLNIRQQIFSADHPEIARVLEDIGVALYSQGNYYESEHYLFESLRIREKAYGPNHGEVASTLSHIGNLFNFQVRYTDMKPVRERWLRILESVYGPESAWAAMGNWAVGWLYYKLERPAEAEHYLTRALELQKKVYGPRHPERPKMFQTYLTLARLKSEQEDWDAALAYYLDQKTFLEELYGPRSQPAADAVLNMTDALRELEKYSEAESLLTDYLPIWEESQRADKIAETHHYLGCIYEGRKDVRKALEHFEIAASLADTALDTESAYYASILTDLSITYERLGQIDKSQQAMARALQVWMTGNNILRSNASGCARRLARLYAMGGDYDNCRAAYEKYTECYAQFIEHVFSYSSEERKLLWAEKYPISDDVLLTLATAQGMSDLFELGFEMVLRQKAFVVEAMMSQKEVAYCSKNPEIVHNFKMHSAICAEIANMSFTDVWSDSFADSIQSLYKTKDSLEAELSIACSEFKDDLASQSFQLQAIYRAIPETGVLYEINRYTSVDIEGSSLDSLDNGSDRYLAISADRNGRIAFHDIGPADLIDSLVMSARELIYRTQGQIYSPAAVSAEDRLRQTTSRLYEVVFAPLAEILDNKTEIFISPDGLLNLLPFEILSAPDGSYLIENYRLSYLSSGRDLLRYRDTPPPEGSMYVVADPDFDSAEPGAVIDPATMLSSVSLDAELHGPPMRGILDCLETDFTRLGHSRTEAESVTKHMRDLGESEVNEYYDSLALEDILKRISEPPRVLHLATHGFFCETEKETATIKDNPLLRSGLALAGANRTISGEADSTMTEDGILTALEVSGLNLVGTDLAVLSACESGVGEFVNGEGMFGLRRAFQHAGAETIVMSLWSVPDRETSQLMDGFYRRWLNGKTKRDALRESALEILNQSREKRGCGHPLLWGGFILAGNPN